MLLPTYKKELRSSAAVKQPPPPPVITMPVAAIPSASTAAASPTKTSRELREFLADLITANHILAQHGLADGGFGNVSLRNPEDPNTFIMAGPGKPAALMQSQHDMAVYSITNEARPVGAVTSPGKGSGKGMHAAGTSAIMADSPCPERVIHSELYKRFPELQCVVHVPSKAAVALTCSGRALKPVWHMAAFIGESAPVFDSWLHLNADDKHNLLLGSSHIGNALATLLADDESDGSGSRSKHNDLGEETGPSNGNNNGMLDNLPEGQPGKQQTRLPQHTVVLQRGHGLVTWGTSLELAVYRAVQADENAKIQVEAERLLVGRRGGTGASKVEYLTAKEVADCREMNDSVAVGRAAWQTWAAEVRANRMFRNDLEGSASPSSPLSLSSSFSDKRWMLGSLRSKGNL